MWTHQSDAYRSPHAPPRLASPSCPAMRQGFWAHLKSLVSGAGFTVHRGCSYCADAHSFVSSHDLRHYLWFSSGINADARLAATAFKVVCLLGRGTAAEGRAELGGTDHAGHGPSIVQGRMPKSGAERYLGVSGPSNSSTFFADATQHRRCTVCRRGVIAERREHALNPIFDLRTIGASIVAHTTALP